LAAYRDRFRDAADFHLRVDGRDEFAGQLDAFTDDRGKAIQRKGDPVGPRPQVFDGVLADAIGDDRAGFLDERGAGRFDGEPRQNGAEHVARRADARCLREGGGGNAEERGQDHERSDRSPHVILQRLTKRTSTRPARHYTDLEWRCKGERVASARRLTGDSTSGSWFRVGRSN